MKSPFLPVMPLGHEYDKEEPLTSSLKHSRIYMHFLAYIVQTSILFNSCFVMLVA